MLSMALTSLLALYGCSTKIDTDETQTVQPDTDTDVDTDTDTDVDTDTDTDTDVDTDTDTDTDVDTDTDTDTDTDVDTDTDTGDTGDVLPGDVQVVGVAVLSGALVVDGTTHPARGTADQWLPILAGTDQPDQVAWVAGIGFSGDLHPSGPAPSHQRVAVDPDSGDVFVVFDVRPTLGTGATTIELTDPSGAVVVTGETHANHPDLVDRYREPYLARFDADGTPLWLERLAQGSGEHECTTVYPLALDVDSPDVLVRLAPYNVDDVDTTTQPLVLGPGDPGEATLTIRENQRAVMTASFAKSDGSLQDYDLLADTTTNYGGVSGSTGFTHSGHWYDPVTDRVGVAGSVNNYVTLGVEVSSEEAVPVPVPDPGGNGYRAIWGTYDRGGLVPDLVTAAAGTVASEAAYFSFPLADGSTLVSATLASPVDATFASASGDQVFTAGEDDQGWLARYDATGELTWARRTSTTPSTASLAWYDAIDDGSRLLVLGHTRAASSVVVGPDDTTPVSLTGLDATARHIVLAQLDRTTGEVDWATIIRQDSPAPSAGLLGLLFSADDGEVVVRTAASGDVDYGGTLVSHGPGVHWVKATFDDSGSFLGSVDLATLSVDDASSVVHSDEVD